jgi:parallel beta-helix repeat protein
VVGNPAGISLLSGDSNVLTGNVADGNSGSGIVLGNSGNLVPLTNSRVSSNTTNGNGLSGIQVTIPQPGSFGNEIFSNLSSVGNAVWDLEDDNLPSCGTDFRGSNVAFKKTPASCVHQKGSGKGNSTLFSPSLSACAAHRLDIALTGWLVSEPLSLERFPGMPGYDDWRMTHIPASGS